MQAPGTHLSFNLDVSCFCSQQHAGPFHAQQSQAHANRICDLLWFVFVFCVLCVCVLNVGFSVLRVCVLLCVLCV